MILDELYGDGAFNGLAKVMEKAGLDPTVGVSISGVPDEVVLRVSWPDGHFLGMNCRKCSVYFFACTKDPVWYAALCEHLPGYMKGLGVETFLSMGFTEEDVGFLLHGSGFKREDDSLRLTWSL